MSIFSEQFLTLTEAAKRLPGRPSVSTLHRWRTTGVSGIKLTTTKVGGRRVVAVSDLEKFIDAVTAAADKHHGEKSSNSKQRQRHIEAAEAELAGLGILQDQHKNQTDRK